MRHEHCGGQLKRYKQSLGKFQCATCQAIIDIGRNTTAHMTSDNDNSGEHSRRQPDQYKSRSENWRHRGA